MGIDTEELIVRPNIPMQCLASIETSILKRVFDTDAEDNYLSCFGFWLFGVRWCEKLYPDDELTKALADSREICPGLCAAVEQELRKNGQIILGAVNYEKIFQYIVQRHPSHLSYVSIREAIRDKWGITDESWTLITADAIESIGTSSENGHFKRKIVHRNTTALPFILTRDE
jgi:hypothetical protein